LPEDDYLEHVWIPACPVRYDTSWLDWVNLSITDINSALYTIAAGKWNPGERWWGVLSFSPEILDHEAVWFATTNNMYPAAKRGQGLDGFEALFAEEVAGRYSKPQRRGRDFPSARPTDPQAEVLYPGQLSTEYLQRIYVSDLLSRRAIRAQCEAVGHPEVEIVLSNDIFT
jgi:ssDNA thymidine ADP-ribosyltransferase, DarT